MINIKILENIQDAKTLIKDQINIPYDTTKYEIYVYDNDQETIQYLEENEYPYTKLHIDQCLNNMIEKIYSNNGKSKTNEYIA